MEAARSWDDGICRSLNRVRIVAVGGIPTDVMAPFQGSTAPAQPTTPPVMD